MSKSMFNAPHFQSPEAAREYLEDLRCADRVCPHCGTVNESFATKKAGVYRCRAKQCRKDFSVTTKSVNGKQPYQVERLASGVLPDVVKQEGHQLPSASQGLGHHLQIGVVPDPSHSRSHASGRPDASIGRLRQDRGSRRNFHWQECVFSQGTPQARRCLP